MSLQETSEAVVTEASIQRSIGNKTNREQVAAAIFRMAAESLWKQEKDSAFFRECDEHFLAMLHCGQFGEATLQLVALRKALAEFDKDGSVAEELKSRRREVEGGILEQLLAYLWRAHCFEDALTLIDEQRERFTTQEKWLYWKACALSDLLQLHSPSVESYLKIASECQVDVATEPTASQVVREAFASDFLNARSQMCYLLLQRGELKQVNRAVELAGGWNRDWFKALGEGAFDAEQEDWLLDHLASADQAEQKELLVLARGWCQYSLRDVRRVALMMVPHDPALALEWRLGDAEWRSDIPGIQQLLNEGRLLGSDKAESLVGQYQLMLLLNQEKFEEATRFALDAGMQPFSKASSVFCRSLANSKSEFEVARAFSFLEQAEQVVLLFELQVARLTSDDEKLELLTRSNWESDSIEFGEGSFWQADFADKLNSLKSYYPDLSDSKFKLALVERLLELFPEYADSDLNNLVSLTTVHQMLEGRSLLQAEELLRSWLSQGKIIEVSHFLFVNIAEQLSARLAVDISKLADSNDWTDLGEHLRLLLSREQLGLADKVWDAADIQWPELNTDSAEAFVEQVTAGWRRMALPKSSLAFLVERMPTKAVSQPRVFMLLAKSAASSGDVVVCFRLIDRMRDELAAHALLDQKLEYVYQLLAEAGPFESAILDHAKQTRNPELIVAATKLNTKALIAKGMFGDAWAAIAALGESLPAPQSSIRRELLRELAVSLASLDQAVEKMYSERVQELLHDPETGELWLDAKRDGFPISIADGIVGVMRANRAYWYLEGNNQHEMYKKLSKDACPASQSLSLGFIDGRSGFYRQVYQMAESDPVFESELEKFGKHLAASSTITGPEEKTSRTWGDINDFESGNAGIGYFLSNVYTESTSEFEIELARGLVAKAKTYSAESTPNGVMYSEWTNESDESLAVRVAVTFDVCQFLCGLQSSLQYSDPMEAVDICKPAVIVGGLRFVERHIEEVFKQFSPAQIERIQVFLSLYHYDALPDDVEARPVISSLKKQMDALVASSLDRQFGSDGIWNGAAGWGHLWLRHYYKTGDLRFLQAADRVAEELSVKYYRELAESKDRSISELGFADGTGGVAVFLRQNHRAQKGDYPSSLFFRW